MITDAIFATDEVKVRNILLFPDFHGFVQMAEHG
jgi:hypothetical protein